MDDGEQVSRIPPWVADSEAVTARLRRKDDDRSHAWWRRLAICLRDTSDLVIQAPHPPWTRDQLDLAQRVSTRAHALRAALGPQHLLPQYWPDRDPVVPDDLRVTGPPVAKLENAGARLAELLDAPWAGDADLACRLDDLLHALSDHAADLHAVLGQEASK